MKIAISADGSIMHNYQTYNIKWLKILPLNVIIDNKEYVDNFDIVQKDLIPLFKQNVLLKTSAASLGSIHKHFDQLFDEGYDYIIHFSMSKELSSMYDTITKIANNDYQNRIIVIDTKGFSTIMLSLAYFTYQEIMKGTKLEELINKINYLIDDNYLFFIPVDLQALKNGGRIPQTLYKISNKFKIFPIIKLDNGKLIKDGVTRNCYTAYTRILEKLFLKFPFEKYDYTLITFVENDHEVNKIFNYISNYSLNSSCNRGIMSINLSVHCGLGTIGVVVTPKINGKSIIDILETNY